MSVNDDPFIANLGHPLWGWQSIQELAPGMRNVLPFLIIYQKRDMLSIFLIRTL